eukprot:314056-Chlamydomonas_euryale.AAC.1
MSMRCMLQGAALVALARHPGRGREIGRGRLQHSPDFLGGGKRSAAAACSALHWCTCLVCMPCPHAACCGCCMLQRAPHPPQSHFRHCHGLEPQAGCC